MHILSKNHLQAFMLFFSKIMVPILIDFVKCKTWFFIGKSHFFQNKAILRIIFNTFLLPQSKFSFLDFSRHFYVEFNMSEQIFVVFLGLENQKADFGLKSHGFG